MIQRSTVSPAQHRAGMGLIIAAGVVHLVEAPEYYKEVKYIGVLFVLSMIGAVIAAVGIHRDEGWGWGVGMLVAGGSFVAYLLSRTVGLPQFREATWAQALEPMGIISLLIEGAFIWLAGSALALKPVLARANSSPQDRHVSRESRRSA